MGLLQSIAEGKYDKDLDRIAEAVRERKENRIYSLKPGDKVKFSDTVRPHYIAGATATIVEWRRTRVLIQMDGGQFLGRFVRGGGKILAHASSLLPVD